MTMPLGPLSIVLLVILALALIVVLWLVSIYNGLVRLRNEVKNAWAQIDVQLKRRHDLIPNLVETVKGYAGHEKSTLEAVVQARSRAVSAEGVEARAQAEATLGGALGRLMLLVEQYPDLKANQNFLALQEELSSTENRIAFARQYYNDNVMQFNTRIESFPQNIVAGMFQFRTAASFEIEDQAAREAPQVKF
jgi:LemA protein